MTRRFRNVLFGSAAILALGVGALATLPPGAMHTQAFAQAAPAATAVQGLPSFADVVERVSLAVVSVRVTRADVGPQAANDGPRGFRQGPGMDEDDEPATPFEFFRRRFGEQFGDRFGQGMPRRGQPRAISQGSGFFISADGYVVTNNHVVQGAREAELVLDGGRTIRARVVGTDPRTDLALLKAEGTGFAFVNFASRAPRVGDWVIAVGNPFGLGGTVTAGIVSARGRDIGQGPYDDYLQIDAPINRGNSGGPTFNAAGEVIGVNTAIFSPTGGSVGIGFAIPAAVTQQVVASLRDNGTVARGWIGVQIQPLTPELAESLNLRQLQGALVASIQSGSPAERAQLRASDVITAVNGEPVRDARELTRRVGTMSPNSTVRLTITREGREQQVNLVLGQLPNADQRADARGQDQQGRFPERGDRGQLDVPNLGLTLRPGPRGDGVVVADIDPNGLAAQRGMRPGDIIFEVAGRPVNSIADIRDALRQARADGRRSTVARVRNGQEMRIVALPIGG